MQLLETLQRRAAKLKCYRSRLLTLCMLPLMMQLEIIDILFFVTSIKHPTEWFDILEYITFSSASTWSSSKFKLVHTLSRIDRDRRFYFNRLPCLWNSLLSIDLNKSCYHTLYRLATHSSPSSRCIGMAYGTKVVDGWQESPQKFGPVNLPT